jgi:hypothetical protein
MPEMDPVQEKIILFKLHHRFILGSETPPLKIIMENNGQQITLFCDF